MNVIDVTSLVLSGADDVIPIAVLLNRATDAGQAPVLPRERLLHPLQDTGGVSVRCIQEGVEVVG